MDPEQAVTNYSFIAGAPLSPGWTTTPNPNGPAATPFDRYLRYHVAAQPGYNQWLAVALSESYSTAKGCGLFFSIAANTLPDGEVKFTLSGDVILRFVDGVPTYQRWDGGFHNLGFSQIRADGQWHQIVMFVTPTTVSLFEDGIHSFSWGHPVGDSFQPNFAMQVLNRGATMSIDLGEVWVMPPATCVDTISPWDYAILGAAPPPSIMGFRTQAGGPQVSFGDGYVRFAATPMPSGNKWSWLDVAGMTMFGVFSYWVRVNASGGSETKITFPGDNILRLTDGGTQALWTLFDEQGGFQKVGDTSIRAGQANYTVVTFVCSASAICILENGFYVCTRAYPHGLPRLSPGLAVQHLDYGTNVSVDIGGFRTVPSTKPHESIGLVAESLAYLYGAPQSVAATIPSFWNPLTSYARFGMWMKHNGDNSSVFALHVAAQNLVVVRIVARGFQIEVVNPATQQHTVTDMMQATIDWADTSFFYVEFLFHSKQLTLTTRISLSTAVHQTIACDLSAATGADVNLTFGGQDSVRSDITADFALEGVRMWQGSEAPNETVPVQYLRGALDGAQHAGDLDFSRGATTFVWSPRGTLDTNTVQLIVATNDAAQAFLSLYAGLYTWAQGSDQFQLLLRHNTIEFQGHTLSGALIGPDYIYWNAPNSPHIEECFLSFTVLPTGQVSCVGGMYTVATGMFPIAAAYQDATIAPSVPHILQANMHLAAAANDANTFPYDVTTVTSNKYWSGTSKPVYIRFVAKDGTRSSQVTLSGIGFTRGATSTVALNIYFPGTTTPPELAYIELQMMGYPSTWAISDDWLLQSITIHEKVGALRTYTRPNLNFWLSSNVGVFVSADVLTLKLHYRSTVDAATAFVRAWTGSESHHSWISVIAGTQKTYFDAGGAAGDDLNDFATASSPFGIDKFVQMSLGDTAAVRTKDHYGVNDTEGVETCGLRQSGRNLFNRGFCHQTCNRLLWAANLPTMECLAPEPPKAYGMTTLFCGRYGKGFAEWCAKLGFPTPNTSWLSSDELKAFCQMYQPPNEPQISNGRWRYLVAKYVHLGNDVQLVFAPQELQTVTATFLSVLRADISSIPTEDQLNHDEL
jgi:PLAT/LH2 domain